MFVRSRNKRKYYHNAIYIILILQNMYQPGLDLSVVEIEEGDSRGGGGGYSEYISVPKKGGLRCGHSPKRGGLRFGHSPLKRGS